MKEGFKDFYKILGISPNCTQETIKKAFQELAKKFHPDAYDSLDVTGNKFKEISEAYEVLIDPDKRSKYDAERNAFYNSENNINQESINYIYNKSKLWNKNIYEFVHPQKISSKFKYYHQKASIRVPLSLAYEGGEVHATGLPGGIYIIRVPPKTPNGAISIIDTPEGLYQIQLIIDEEAPFKLIGNDIETTLYLNIAESILGCKKTIIDPAGNNLDIFIPECTPHGIKIKIPSKGLGGGNLLVNIEVVFPNKLTDKAIEHFINFIKEIGLQIPSK